MSAADGWGREAGVRRLEAASSHVQESATREVPAGVGGGANRARSAVREVGKALGLSLDLIDRLAKGLFWFDKNDADAGRYRDLGVDPGDPMIRRLGAIASEILGIPRHLSQHVGGFMLTERTLSETVPIERGGAGGAGGDAGRAVVP